MLIHIRLEDRSLKIHKVEEFVDSQVAGDFYAAERVRRKLNRGSAHRSETSHGRTEYGSKLAKL